MREQIDFRILSNVPTLLHSLMMNFRSKPNIHHFAIPPASHPRQIMIQQQSPQRTNERTNICHPFGIYKYYHPPLRHFDPCNIYPPRILLSSLLTFCAQKDMDSVWVWGNNLYSSNNYSDYFTPLKKLWLPRFPIPCFFAVFIGDSLSNKTPTETHLLPCSCPVQCETTTINVLIHCRVGVLHDDWFPGLS